jgi:hypothetical protein
MSNGASAITARLVSLLAIPLALGIMTQALRLARSDLLFTQAETEVSFWGRDSYHPTPGTIEATGSSITQLVSLSPQHPDYLALQAAFHDWQAYWSEDFSASRKFSAAAVAAQHGALESRPAHRRDWLALSRYASRVPETKTMRIRALERAEQLSPPAIDH